MGTGKSTKSPKAGEQGNKKKAASKPTAAIEAGAAQSPAHNSLLARRRFTGTVTSNKMQKTIVVRVDRKVKHAQYGKFITRSQKFKAHDEKNDAKIGDLVSIVESRPLSKDKRWALQSVIRRAGQAALIEVQ